MLQVEDGAAYGARLVTTEPIRAGEVVGRLSGLRIMAKPTYLSIQVGPAAHVEDLGVFAYLNHSCRPSVRVCVVDDPARLEIVAARDLAAGDELTFFYPSTEWEMDRPFTCLCGVPDCLGTIAGARHLPLEVLERYQASPYIHTLAAQQAALHLR